VKNPLTKLGQLAADLRDTNDALRRAACGGVIERCGCGCFTLQQPCSKCARERAEAAKNGQPKE